MSNALKSDLLFGVCVMLLVETNWEENWKRFVVSSAGVCESEMIKRWVAARANQNYKTKLIKLIYSVLSFEGKSFSTRFFWKSFLMIWAV